MWRNYQQYQSEWLSEQEAASIVHKATSIWYGQAYLSDGRRLPQMGWHRDKPIKYTTEREYNDLYAKFCAVAREIQDQMRKDAAQSDVQKIHDFAQKILEGGGVVFGGDDQVSADYDREDSPTETHAPTDVPDEDVASD